MIIFDRAVLTCPHCGVKENITMPETGYWKTHECASCKQEITTSDKKCCVICEHSDMYCLQKQNMGSCAW